MGPVAYQPASLAPRRRGGAGPLRASFRGFSNPLFAKVGGQSEQSLGPLQNVAPSGSSPNPLCSDVSEVESNCVSLEGVAVGTSIRKHSLRSSASFGGAAVGGCSSKVPAKSEQADVAAASGRLVTSSWVTLRITANMGQGQSGSHGQRVA